MEQLALFRLSGQSKGRPQHLMEYQPNLLTIAESDTFLLKFINDTPWQQSSQKMWDEEYLTPRLTCWYGDTDRMEGTLPRTQEYCTSDRLSNH